MVRFHIVVILVCLMITACTEKTVTFEDFFDRIDQTATERIISSELEAEQVINLSDYDVFSPGSLTHNSTHLYLLDWGEMAVVKISKSDPSDLDIWQLKEGEGPGELTSIRGFSANDERVFIGDDRSFRIVEMDTDGNHKRDLGVSFAPGNFVLSEAGNIINSSPIQQPDLFVIYEPGTDSLRGFEEGEVPMEEAMKYTGYVAAGSGHLFYGGYSEPVLRKYSTTGELMFSRSTIDNPNTEDNYENHSNGEFAAFGFSENANYSTFNLSASKDRLFVIPHHNDNSGFRYLDIYDTENGDYLESLQLDLFPSDLAIDSDWIYTLAQQEDDYLVRWYSLDE